MKAIFKRELRSFFHTMTGPVFMAGTLVFIGIFFTAFNIVQGYPHFSAVLANVEIVLLLMVPILTMRSFAEEKRSRTDQLLLTSPVSVTGIVMGKYLAMVAVLGLTMLITCGAPPVIALLGGSTGLSDYAAILLFLLLGAAYISIGMFISSLTESQVIAAVGTFCILLILQLIDGIASFVPEGAEASLVCFVLLILLAAAAVYHLTGNLYIAGGTGIFGAIVLAVFFLLKRDRFSGLFGSFMESVSLVNRFSDIVSQVFDLSTVVYYLSVSGLFIFLTVQSVQKRRWSQGVLK